MADILMTAITPDEAEGRTVIKTGLSTLGQGKHTYFCGHCGRPFMQRIDLSNFGAKFAFHCAECDSFSINPQAKQ